MRAPDIALRPRWRHLAGALLACTAIQASAQSHEARQDGYVLRASTVPSQAIGEETARAHGIRPAPDRAVLNVSIQRDPPGTVATVRAQVTAETTDLVGRTRSVELREVVENGGVSYTGSYDVLPRQVLDFHITALPEQHAIPIILRFRDRIWTR
jgi:hypothetical protein